MNGMFHGLNVVDASTVLAGPLTGTFFAEGGARVLKVEPPGGDVTRSWTQAGETRTETSAYYEAANEGKEVVQVDLTTREGRSWLHHELASADVLLENAKSSSWDRLGMRPDKLMETHPHLIHVRLVGYDDSPDRLAYDVVIQAETGFMSMNGHPEMPPARLPVALMDVLASHQMRAAVLTGLWRREKTGQGMYAEVSLFGSGITALANQGTSYLMNGRTPQRLGSAHPNIAPYGDLLQTQGGHVVLAAGNNRQFRALCNVLGAAELADDARFADNPLRVHHRQELVTALEAKAANWSRDALLHALRNAAVPAGAVFNVAEALEQPGVRSRYVVGESNKEKLRTSAITWHPNEARRFEGLART